MAKSMKVILIVFIVYFIIAPCIVVARLFIKDYDDNHYAGAVASPFLIIFSLTVIVYFLSLCIWTVMLYKTNNQARIPFYKIGVVFILGVFVPAVFWLHIILV